MLPAAGPEILFERAVCDLGQVGVGTGNLCEFRFGNGAGYLRSNQGSCVPEGLKREVLDFHTTLH
jgi:hypothetical protein